MELPIYVFEVIRIRKNKFFISLLFFVLSSSIFYFWQNNYIVTTYYNYENSKIPASFNNYKILQLSDWHNKYFGYQLIEKIDKADPDIIVLTGDFLDVYNPNEKLANDLLTVLTSKYPVYFVSGNHEKALFKKNYEIKYNLKKHNVVFLENKSIDLEKDGEYITLYGIRDYTYNKNIEYDLKTTINKENTNFSILLAHQPQYFENYSKYNVDLVFSGHEHGGQIRLPFIGSIYSHQGWFAEWTAGIHKLNDTTMIISRGLGNSEKLPIRLFNQPELVVTTLKSITK